MQADTMAIAAEPLGLQPLFCQTFTTSRGVVQHVFYIQRARKSWRGPGGRQAVLIERG